MSELHVILLWSNALNQSEAILADIRKRFIIRDVVSIAWTPERFAENLTRFYGSHLPPGSDKERHCGTAPFLVVVVEENAAVYERRWTNRGFADVNRAVFRAKIRYRGWTGNGHRVHTSDTAEEAAHDLFFLLGRRPAWYVERCAPWDGTITQHRADVLGSNGWESVDELREAIRLVMPDADVSAGTGIDGLDVVVDDVWWAERIANGRRIDGHGSASAVPIGGRDVIIRFHPSGRAAPPPSAIIRWVQPFVGALRRVSRLLPDR